jgi:phosphatidylserine decarboxylase
MTIHKEGYRIIFFTLLVLTAVYVVILFSFPAQYIIQNIFLSITVIFFILIVQFFRIPFRKIDKNSKHIIAPADGKIVVIEETVENEYFHDKRIQISIFMSPLNVHNNRNPVSGIVSYFKYHPGKYLVAWHPKSSTENERTTLVIKTETGVEILLRQIAGAMARRIKWYVKEGQSVQQGDEFGFITFGSRVDIFLPLGTDIKVNIGDISVGGKTILGHFA